MTLHYVGKDESAGYKKNCSTLGGLFSAPEVSYIYVSSFRLTKRG
ncbi:hypothetical protein ES288_D09G120300v1 [Gossypium darwinii]|uniref:Uncharacterized protein n=2 Tax=Gossypium TaxID=3633 RepID=A0A5D2JI06_GOSTO|nr:hypothetical protein ES288_D09G120300v1 [Gossypium darwinii]TYH53673.1 hypothetical protein ES332_D09G116200v1 [Gossypium tomentosum]